MGMSRLYETLRRIELQRGGTTDAIQIASMQPTSVNESVVSKPEMDSATEGAMDSAMDSAPVIDMKISVKSRLVALTDPRGPAAEQFRSLVARLENEHKKTRGLRSLQVTSALGKEGKTLLAANLAMTIAKQSGSRVLLVEGDLHCPTLASLLGLDKLEGIGEWWMAREVKKEISRYVRRLKDKPVWFLGAGVNTDSPSEIIQSTLFSESFVQLAASFDWVVVDSTPILPVVDANLWSRLVDGTLMVVREGVTPLPAVKKAVQSLDNPKLVGIIFNEASEFQRNNYGDAYYTHSGSKTSGT
jgi:capsular exopolysaccharide synthesis family protein